MLDQKTSMAKLQCICYHICTLFFSRGDKFSIVFKVRSLLCYAVSAFITWRLFVARAVFGNDVDLRFVSPSDAGVASSFSPFVMASNFRVPAFGTIGQSHKYPSMLPNRSL
mmetsp:Transcript_6102/g.8972  ORF Transcript_6102/g.8972 Transcript_6102/m.8972 type:complete len:111 (+) Transcript_6102:870-1202(+)